MNKIYRIVWNEGSQCWVAVMELAMSHGRRGSTAVLGACSAGMYALRGLALALCSLGLAHAGPPAATQLPSGAQVVAGQATLSQPSSTVLNVNQSSQAAIVNWQSFNVGSSAAVNFVQPSASSSTLNRVLDSNPSQIYGRISAPGQVFFTNPNGMYFAPGASVEVGGLTATTHSISDADFMAGNYRFTRDGATGAIVNEGTLTASLGGYIALLAPEVRNRGVIVARMGTVALAAGEMVTLQMQGTQLSHVTVSPATVKTLVDNASAVLAPGGLIILSAQALDQVQGSVVNNSGTLEATGLVESGGTIRLTASGRITHSGSIRADAAPGSAGKGGSVTLIADLGNDASVTAVSGSISARGGQAGGDGGFIETSAASVQIADSARVDTSAALGLTGSWLIDPKDFTIAAGKAGTVTSGTPSGDISGATLSTALNTSDVTISSSLGSNASGSGDINVNDAVSWTKNMLTLTAARDINVNAVMKAGAVNDTGSAGTYATLTLKPATLNGADAAVAGGLVKMAMGTSGFIGQVSYTDKNAGTGNKSITLDAATVNDGNSGANYSVTLAGNATSTISQRAITLTGLTAANKTYDGNTAATITSGSFTNLAGTETLGISGAGAFNNRNAAPGKTVTVADVTTLSKTAGTGVWSNYQLSTTGSMTTSADVAQKVVTLTAGPMSKTYDGLLSYGTQAADLSSLSSQLGASGDSVNAATITYTDKNAGTGNKSVTLDAATVNDSNGGANYSVTLAGNATSTISQRAITLTSLTAANKTYDGNTAASITSGSFTNLAGTETLGISGAGTFDDRNAAPGKTVTVADVTALSKADGTGAWSNYQLSTTGTMATTANVAQKVVTLTAGDVSKTYDGLLSYSTQAADLSALSSQLGVAGDTVNAAILTYTDKNAGTGNKSITLDAATVSDSNGGANYSVTLAGNATSTISQRAITLTGLTAANKTYDGTAAASITSGSFANLAGTETLGISGAGTFDNRNAAPGKTVTITDVTALSKTADTGVWSNYQLSTTGSMATTADVAQKVVTLTAGPVSKTYDGLLGYNTQASDLSNLSSQLGVAGDTVNAATLTYTDKNAGTGSKSITLDAATVNDSNGGANYSVTLAGNTTSTISQRAITLTGLTAANKTYDGNTAASITTGSFANLAGTETLGISGAGAFDNRNAAPGKTVTVADVTTLSKTAGTGVWSNYQLSTTGSMTTTADVAQKVVTLNAGPMSKNYDALLSYSTQAADLSNLSSQLGVAGDAVSSATLTYTDKNAGTGNKSITLDAATVNDSNGGANYSVTLAGNAASTIRQRAITLTGLTAANKTYDGTTAASITSGSFANLAGSETLGISGAGTFDDRNAGTGKVVTVADVTTLSKTAGTGVWSNYQLSTSGSMGTTGNVTPKVVMLTAGNVSKTYDGLLSYSTQAADLSSLSSQLGVAGDTVNAATLTYTDKNAGTGNKSITLNAATVNDSNGGGNYSVTLVGNSSSTINQRSITLTGLTAANKTYDGSNSASVTSGSFANLAGTETLGISGAGTFDDRNAALGKVVTVTDVTTLSKTAGTGVWSNYQLSTTGTMGTTANVAQKVVTLTAGPVSKTYDGLLSYSTLAADLSSLSSQLGVSGDTVNAATITYTDKNAGTGNKSITLDAATVNDNNGGANYSVTLAGNATSTISQRNITLTGLTATNKTYDGNTAASITSGSFANLAGTETLGISGAGTFDNRNAGAGKAITVSDVTTLNKADGTGVWSNYQLSTTGTMGTTADVAQKVVTLTAGPVSKTYDGLLSYRTQAADLSALDSQLGVAGDTVSAATLTYADKNAGAGNKSITLDAAKVNDSNGGGNYSVTLVGNSTSTINQRAITLTGLTAANKTYDGTIAASITSGSFANLAGSETLGIGGAGTFDNRNAAQGKAVAVSDITTLSKTDETGIWSNYQLSTTGTMTTTADVAKKVVTLTAGPVSKTYDGLLSYSTQAADLSSLSSQLGISGDSVSAATLTYADKNAGNGNKSVTLDAATVNDDNSGNNYSVALAGNKISSIAKAALLVRANDALKDQDGIPFLGGNGVRTVGLLNGDDASALAGTLVYGGNSQGAVATGTYGIEASGLDASNYAIRYEPGTLQIRPVAPPVKVSGSTSSGNVSGNSVEPVRTQGAGSTAPTRTESGIANSLFTVPVDTAPGLGAVWQQVVREPTVEGPGFTLVYVPASVRNAPQGFRFPLPEQTLSRTQQDIPIQVTQQSGEALPDWLRFDSSTRTFVASRVPPGGLPLRVRVIAGNQSNMIELLETKG